MFKQLYYNAVHGLRIICNVDLNDMCIVSIIIVILTLPKNNWNNCLTENSSCFLKSRKIFCIFPKIFGSVRKIFG